jgi:P-type Ca2+ transporter type 2C
MSLALSHSTLESAIAAFRHMSAAHAHLVRDGEPTSVPATDVVPGHILIVEDGDTVPADGRLVHSIALHVAEAALTGENLPVSKAVNALPGGRRARRSPNMIYSGTSVTFGKVLCHQSSRRL